ncbi:GntR family transcriptional regulator [Catellatospora sp. NPDC049609]|uniref:GntR family transcriptional regulator n=1 Tax=Catellatospora sp. NPDC049609 TaxID=3155505 RepID=UPI003441A659
MPADLPAYLQIAAELRCRIVAGELAPGAKLPSESRLMAMFGVSNTVTKRAIAVLKAEGLVEGRHGSGVYVRHVRRLVRDSQGRDQRRRQGPTSPFARDVTASGQRPSWEHDSAEVGCPDAIAARLGVEPGEPVLRTRYRYLADGGPIQLATSYEPLSITRGTPVELPEDGAAVGVVARMDVIGVRIDECVEEIIARAAHPDEIERLGLPSGGALMMVVERTYLAGGRAVETADIVMAADRYQLRYRWPVE